ncbi:MAG TPA: AraC family transcriptional regulator [Candidatus Kapabacteria bacterium]|nr:AraC family transcriptional regulator [Candidatus Kapabacteria bacterium]
MIIRELPAFALSERTSDATQSAQGFPNALVLIAGQDYHYPEHVSPLSIMCSFGGTSEYRLRRKRFLIDDSSYLILNEGQRFSTTVHSDVPVESLQIWFQPGFAAYVLRDLVTPSDRLLEPDQPTQQPVLFFERTYPHDTILSPHLYRIRSVVAANLASEGWEEEQYHLLLERMLYMHRSVASEVERIPGVRLSTKIEIYRRLHEAKEYIDANIGERLSLGKISGVAFMSSHHFLRLFRQAFGQTPHQYLTLRRLEEARRLLSQTSLSIAEICRRVGFISHGSFSWMFRRRIGSSPEEYRYHSRQ